MFFTSCTLVFLRIRSFSCSSCPDRELYHYERLRFSCRGGISLPDGTLEKDRPTERATPSNRILVHEEEESERNIDEALDCYTASFIGLFPFPYFTVLFTFGICMTILPKETFLFRSFFVVHSLPHTDLGLFREYRALPLSLHSRFVQQSAKTLWCCHLSVCVFV